MFENASEVTGINTPDIQPQIGAPYLSQMDGDAHFKGMHNLTGQVHQCGGKKRKNRRKSQRRNRRKSQRRNRRKSQRKTRNKRRKRKN